MHFARRSCSPSSPDFNSIRITLICWMKSIQPSIFFPTMVNQTTYGHSQTETKLQLSLHPDHITNKKATGLVLVLTYFEMRTMRVNMVRNRALLMVASTKRKVLFTQFWFPLLLGTLKLKYERRYHIWKLWEAILDMTTRNLLCLLFIYSVKKYFVNIV